MATPSKMRATVRFEVSGDAPHRELTAATDAGLAAARAAAGEGGSVDAAGSLGSARDGKRTVKVELTLRVASPAAAMAAERAFADAFVARLAAHGSDAARL